MLCNSRLSYNHMRIHNYMMIFITMRLLCALLVPAAQRREAEEIEGMKMNKIYATLCFD